MNAMGAVYFTQICCSIALSQIDSQYMGQFDDFEILSEKMTQEDIENERKLRINIENKKIKLRQLQNQFIHEQKIEANSKDCIAYNFQNNSCKIMVNEFNAYATNNFFNHLDTIVSEGQVSQLAKSRQQRILNHLLKQQYYKERIEDHKKTVIDKLDLFYEKDKKSRKCDLNDSILQLKYHEYYDYAFATTEQVNISLISSSDSILLQTISNKIDSLDEILKTVPKKNFKVRQKLSKAINDFPWLYYPDSLLPENLLEITDTLGVGEWTRPIRVSFGHIILRISKIIERPKISIEKANPYLCALDLYEPKKKTKKEKEIEAYTYYLNHELEFVQQDTLQLKVWLKPPKFSDQISSSPSFDTIGIRPIYSTQKKLPHKVRKFLREELEFNPKAKSIKAFHLPYGDWLIKIVKKNKGIGIKPYSKVKNEIMAKLFNSSKFDAITQAISLINEKQKTSEFHFLKRDFENSFGKKNKKLIRDDFEDWVKNNIELSFVTKY